MKSIWYQRAAQALRDARAKIPPDATVRQIHAALDAAYPFGPRANFPYRQWLKAKKDFLWTEWPKLFPKPGRARAARRSFPSYDPNQQVLFPRMP